VRTAILLLVTALPAAAFAQPAPPAETEVHVGGYLQPQVQMRQNDDVAQFDEDGFRLRRTRLLLGAERETDEATLSLALEAELTSPVGLLDAYVSARRDLPRNGRLRIDLGQVKAPFSRQTLVSDSDLQLPEKARLTALAPDRQLGVRAIVNPPAAPWVELSGGVFNGDGRNVVDNIDEHFMFVGRVAVRPIGPTARLVESGMGQDAVSVAFSAARNLRDLGGFSEKALLLGVDAFVSLQGASATAEYLWARYRFPEGAPAMNYKAQGLNLQAGYLLPVPGRLYRRFELAARYEEVDPRYPNDVFGIIGPDDEFQSERSVVGAASYYHDEHDLKLQLSFAHNIEVEDRDRTGGDATYANDTLLLQATLRLEQP
jgi:hypothetical protein